MDMLADFLGHDIRVHRQFYRLPMDTLQIAKVSKVFMAAESGDVAQYAGKSLDDIVINNDDTLSEGEGAESENSDSDPELTPTW